MFICVKKTKSKQKGQIIKYQIIGAFWTQTKQQ